MKPAEFYKLYKRGLGGTLKTAGFSPAKGGVALWSRPHDTGWLFVSCLGNKWGWSEPFGSDFSLSITLGASERYAENFGNSQGSEPGRTHILEFFDVEAVRCFMALRSDVIDKGLQRAASAIDVVGMIGATVQSAGKALERDEPPLPFTALVFPWLDAEDIARWAEFLQPIIFSCPGRVVHLYTLDCAARQSYMMECSRTADQRTEEEKARHKAAKRAAIDASTRAISMIGGELEKQTKG